MDGRRIDQALPGRQGRLLFAYLVVNRAQPIARSEVADALWPERAPTAVTPQSRRSCPSSGASLAPSGWKAEAGPSSSLRRAPVDRPRSRRRGAAPGRGGGRTERVGRGLRAGARRSAHRRQAVPCGGGRTVDRRTAAEARRHLPPRARADGQAGLGIGGGELDTAERAARTLVARAPYRRSGYRFLMQVLAACDNPAEGLRVYEELRVRLRDDLGTAPSPTTQALHKRLLSG
jgi:hypothetical protein